MYVAGAPENERDFLLNRISDARLRARLIVAFTPTGDGSGGLKARFDIVLGEG
jgi:protocatechuate 3,4-dioxygenase beta subunit